VEQGGRRRTASPSGGPAAARLRALLSILSLLLLLSPFAARAQSPCSLPDGGAGPCRVEIAAPVVARMLQQQQRPRWCWAAAISMVFAGYGYPVAQSDIVERMYGQAVDAGVPTHILPAVIEREWVSDDGLALKASTRYQAAAPGATVPASITLMISSLRAGQPLILSAHGHAVVVVGIAYERQGQAMRITGGTVIDPTPGVGLRPLQAQELGVALLASVAVAPVPQATATLAELPPASVVR